MECGSLRADESRGATGGLERRPSYARSERSLDSFTIGRHHRTGSRAHRGISLRPGCASTLRVRVVRVLRLVFGIVKTNAAVPNGKRRAKSGYSSHVGDRARSLSAPAASVDAFHHGRDV